MASKESRPRRREPAAGRKKKQEPAAPRRPSGRLLRVGLIVFLSAWMFVLGILVGRGTAPVKFDIQKIEKQLAELKAAALEKTRLQGRKIETAVADPTAAKPIDQSLGFYETLRNRHADLSFHAAPPVNRRQPRPQAPVKVPAAAKKAHARPPQKPATGPAPKAKRIKTPTRTARAAQHASPGVHARILTVQVASLKNQATAVQMASRLKAMGFPAYTHIGKVPGSGIWYRVRVGRFTSRHRAAGMQAKLKKAHFSAVIVGR